jgi:hypothetical protein
LHKDASWIAVREWAVDHGLTFIGHESLKDDDGTDQLQLLINELQAKAEGEEPKEKSILDSDSEDVGVLWCNGPQLGLRLAAGNARLCAEIRRRRQRTQQPACAQRSVFNRHSECIQHTWTLVSRVNSQQKMKNRNGNRNIKAQDTFSFSMI